jgi:nucleotide-binding universal stress UspA family protein
MYKSILLPIDGSELSLRAARQGIALAKALGARVTAIMVTTPWAIQFAG